MIISIKQEDKISRIVEKSWDIVKRSCRISNDKSLFFRTIGREDINDIRICPSTIDSDYGYYGNINGRGAYFNISDENRYVNFRVFLENVSGLSRYASCGLQKVIEDGQTSLYYHILNGRIISEVKCKKGESMLSELNRVEEIKPFVLQKRI